MSITRIYSVAKATNGTDARLVEATSSAQAMRFVAEQLLHVAIADPKTVARLMGDGVKIEDATKEAA